MYTLKLLARNAKIDEQIYLSTAGKGLTLEINYYGSALSGIGNMIMKISNTKLNNNKAEWGRVISIRQEVQLLITNSSLDGNTVDSDGGPIYGWSDVTLEISNTQLNNNKASQDGGAIHIWKQAQLLITNCSLDGNTADRDGGAILVLLNVQLEIDRSNFIRNALTQHHSNMATDVSTGENSSVEVRCASMFIVSLVSSIFPYGASLSYVIGMLSGSWAMKMMDLSRQCNTE